MIIKDKVELYGLSKEIWHAAKIVSKIYLKHNRTLVITSGRDGKHKKNSKHYLGNAIDTRIYYFTDEVAQLVTEEIKSKLGALYYVLLESDHIHIQYNG